MGEMEASQLSYVLGSPLLATIQQAPIATHYKSVFEADVHYRKQGLALVLSLETDTHTLKRQYKSSLHSIPKAVRVSLREERQALSHHTLFLLL